MSPDTPEIARAMVAFAWAWMAVGISIGALLGFFAFDGPMPTPQFMGEYDSYRRRLVRLGHVAFIMLPLISMSYASQIGDTHLSPDTKVLAVKLCWTGMVGVPVICMTGAFWPPTKYLFPIPVASFLACLIIMASGK